MTNKQRDALMRRRAAGMRVISNEEIARRQREAAAGARNAWPAGIDHMRGQAAMTNFWCEATDAARLGNGANVEVTGAERASPAKRPCGPQG